MTQPGRGGQQPAPINSAAGQATVVGTQPGVTGGIVRARQVIISGTADGVFVYSGTPGPGTLVGSWAAASGTDPYGNTYPDGLVIGAASAGPQVILVPSPGGGTSSGIEFPMPAPALSNPPNIVAAEEPYLAISGPALAASGEEDWVQILLWGNDSAAARLEFRRISTTGAVIVSASYNDAGWAFGDAVDMAGGLTVTGGLSADLLQSAGGDFSVDSSGNITCGPDVNLTPPMGVPADYPLSSDPNTGPNWATGERGYINDLVACVNQLIGEMINRGMIS